MRADAACPFASEAEFRATLAEELLMQRAV